MLFLYCYFILISNNYWLSIASFETVATRFQIILNFSSVLPLFSSSVSQSLVPLSVFWIIILETHLTMREENELSFSQKKENCVNRFEKQPKNFFLTKPDQQYQGGFLSCNLSLSPAGVWNFFSLSVSRNFLYPENRAQMEPKQLF